MAVICSPACGLQLTSFDKSYRGSPGLSLVIQWLCLAAMHSPDVCSPGPCVPGLQGSMPHRSSTNFVHMKLPYNVSTPEHPSEGLTFDGSGLGTLLHVAACSAILVVLPDPVLTCLPSPFLTLLAAFLKRTPATKTDP